jgi:hypothetical protein
MAAEPIAVRATGLVTSVGLSAPAACAAMRCKLTNPSETRFIDSAGEWIMGHSVQLEKPKGSAHAPAGTQFTRQRVARLLGTELM